MLLLGAAKYLCETRNFDGSVVVIFQPAEEGGAGALAMVEDRLMDRFGVDEVYGMHNMPGIPLGQFAIRKGGIMAAPDKFTITVKAVVAMPLSLTAPQIPSPSRADRHQSTIDRIPQCRSPALDRRFGHALPGRHHPQHHSQRGADRPHGATLDEEVRDMAEARIRQIAEGIALANGAEAEAEYHRYCPTSTIRQETDYAAEIAATWSRQ